MIGEVVHRCLFIVNIKSELNWSPVIPGRTKTFFGYYDKFPENINEIILSIIELTIMTNIGLKFRIKQVRR